MSVNSALNFTFDDDSGPETDNTELFLVPKPSKPAPKTFTFTVEMTENGPSVTPIMYTHMLKNMNTVLSESNLDKELEKKIITEILNPRYNGFFHYGVRTYQETRCRGILCRMRQNHNQQQNRMFVAYKEGRLENYISRARANGTQRRYKPENIELNIMIRKMLINQARVIPKYLDLVISDPYMEDLPTIIKVMKDMEERKFKDD